MTKIKICGLSKTWHIEYVNQILPDYIGFVFAKTSKRYVSPINAVELKKKLDKQIKVVGVFVNEPIDQVLRLLDNNIIDIAQLHGQEDERQIRFIKEESNRPVIKAFSINSQGDITEAVQSSADYILLDNGLGGTGNSFDWKLISDIQRPYFLAGGLHSANVCQAIQTVSPFAVDVSSGVESNGEKDLVKMKNFVQLVRKGNK